MASNYNSKSKTATSTGDGDAGDLKLVIGVGVFIVFCFLIGYFVLGKKFGAAGSTTSPPTEPVVTNSTVVPGRIQTVSHGGTLTVVDNTAAMEAKRKKAEDEAKKKADEEAKKKADEDAKKLAALETQENTASPVPIPSVSPDPEDLPTGTDANGVAPPIDDSSDKTGQPTETTPTPKVSPVVKPTPTPTPPPVTNTPDDPEDRAAPPPAAVTGTNNGPLYRVRVGTFEEKANAEARATELKTSGYETSLSTDIVDGKVIYRLQVAAYKSEKSAREFAKEVEAKGFKTTISHN